MSLAQGNIYNLIKILEDAYLLLTKAKSVLNQAIALDSSGTTAPDRSSGDWPGMVTNINTAISALQSAQNNIYFYPDNVD